jgi:hypothetical protein
LDGERLIVRVGVIGCSYVYDENHRHKVIDIGAVRVNILREFAVFELNIECQGSVAEKSVSHYDCSEEDEVYQYVLIGCSDR